MATNLPREQHEHFVRTVIAEEARRLLDESPSMPPSHRAWLETLTSSRRLDRKESRMTTVEILRAARALIEDPDRWTQGELVVVDEGGREVAWSADGALRAALGGEHVPTAPLYALECAVNGHVAVFNDRHSHGEVLAAFDKAIALAEGDDASEVARLRRTLGYALEALEALARGPSDGPFSEEWSRVEARIAAAYVRDVLAREPGVPRPGLTERNHA